MKLETRFDLGDMIYSVMQEHEYIEVKCNRCDGDGYFYSKHGNQKIMCPRCKSLGVVKRLDRYIFVPTDCMTVGLVRAQRKRALERDNNYMCLETGIGSGRVYNETKCFASRQEAQVWCDKANKESLDK